MFIARAGVSGEVVITYTDENGNEMPLTVAILDPEIPLAAAPGADARVQTAFPWRLLVLIPVAALGVGIVIVTQKRKRA